MCDLGLILPAKSGFVTPERKKKKEFEKSIEDEKKKLADLKIMFEDRLKSLDSNIKDISLAIKKI